MFSISEDVILEGTKCLANEPEWHFYKGKLELGMIFMCAERHSEHQSALSQYSEYLNHMNRPR